MSDLRGLSRGSKTAAIVILVVLLQVIVVAVLGLGAIARDREEGARIARDEAQARAQADANAVLDRARAGLLRALDAASTARSMPQASLPAPTPWARAFLDLFVVDADGRVRAAADGTLLHVPPDVIAAAEQRVDRVLLERAEKALASLPPSDPAGLEARRRFVREFPFATDGAGYGTAVGEALRLALDVAASADPDPAALLAAVRVAYETAAVNDRPAAARLPFAHVRAELGRLAAAPGREAVAARLAELDRARAGLARVRDYALALARDAAAHPAPTRVFPLRESGPDVVVVGFANVPSVGSGAGRVAECVFARIDRVAASRVVEAEAAGAATGVRVVQREAPRAPDPRAYRLPLLAGDFDVALDVVVPVPPPRAAAAVGPNESFYWTILGLAALGVTTAGAVLVRVLRREVHLARLKTDFVSNLSHELKTPLTSISMFAEMLRDGRLSPAEQAEALGVVGQETDRLQRIVGRMIDVARREAGAVGYDLVPGDLNAPVRAACERFRRLERDAGLSLEVDLAAGLAPVALDAGAVDDAVTNLLTNAWKYRRGDAARVRVATRAVGRRAVELVVADDGIGIPRRERKRVFEMFYRAQSLLTRTVPGTGLGLALVRTIVRVHRGRVRVEATAGGGTTFRVRLPAARGAPRPAPSEAEGPREAPAPSAARATAGHP